MPKLLRPAAPRLIRSHPLAVGLSDAVLLDGPRGWNHANGAAQPAFAGSMAAEWAGDSPGSRASGGTNYATVAGSYNVAAGVSTVSFLWKPVSHTAQFVTVLEKANGASREWAFFVKYNDGANLGNISYFTIGTSLSGDVNYPTGMVDGGTFRLTVTRNAANLLTIYVNGQSKATVTNSGATAVASSAWQIGRAVSGAVNPNAVYGDLFVWPARCLSADEVAQHAAEPWAMLRPAARLLRGLTVHALIADDLGTGAPGLGTPALGQIHALTADSLGAGAPGLGTPGLGQIHALIADSLGTGAPGLGAPSLGQIHALVADDLGAGVPGLGSPVLNAPVITDWPDWVPPGRIVAIGADVRRVAIATDRRRVAIPPDRRRTPVDA